MDRDRALQLAAKLLNMDATKGCTPEEASNAAARLQRLMEEHNLDMLSIQAEQQRATVGEETQETAWRRAPAWAQFLVSKLVRAFGCHPVLAWGGGQRASIRIVGDATQAALCRYFLGYLIDQLPRAFAAFAKTPLGRAHVIMARGREPARTAFIMGAAEAVAARLRKMNEEWLAQLNPQQQASARGLVVVRDAAIRAYLDDAFPNRSASGPKTYHLDPHSYGAGVAHGEAMPLSTGLRGGAAPGTHLTHGA